MTDPDPTAYEAVLRYFLDWLDRRATQLEQAMERLDEDDDDLSRAYWAQAYRALGSDLRHRKYDILEQIKTGQRPDDRDITEPQEDKGKSE